jgi:hypothetical protein
MTMMLSTEFWVVFQMMAMALLLALLVYFVRNYKENDPSDETLVNDSGKRIIALMEPLVNEAEAAARTFESQIIEKKQLIRDLNEKLDSRIISLNLLLNRADAYLVSKSPGGFPDDGEAGMVDMQESILALFDKGQDARQIAETLGVSRKEVDLVISLKKKFIAMENGL